MFSVAMLEPSLALGSDLYNRPISDQPGAIEVDSEQEWEIDQLLKKHIIKKGRGISTQYLVKWKGWGPEYNIWYRIQDLQNAAELVTEYKAQLG
jgi:hypothetical protein